MIHHHLDETLLLEYASGGAPPPRALLVACHLTLCPSCRARAEVYDTVGGALLDAVPASDPLDALLAATLARLDEPAPAPAPPVTDPDGVLPAPLAALVGRFSELPWRWRFPAVAEVELAQRHDGFPARLFRLSAGTFVPRHQHVGDELSLVLTGGFTDDRGHYGRGDLAIRGKDELHEQDIDPGEHCVVLVVADAPFRPRSPIAALASWFARF